MFPLENTNAAVAMFHTGDLHLLVDSVLGVVVGVVAVGLYVLALRWAAGDETTTDGQRSNAGEQSNG